MSSAGLAGPCREAVRYGTEPRTAYQPLRECKTLLDSPDLPDLAIINTVETCFGAIVFDPDARHDVASGIPKPDDKHMGTQPLPIHRQLSKYGADLR